jgi:hypothetical protein
MGNDPTPAFLSWAATQCRTPLAGQLNNNMFGYYKDGQSTAKSIAPSPKDTPRLPIINNSREIMNI